jgi:putative flippase GtrA
VNFTVNRMLVFADGRRTPLPAAAARYFGLVLALLAANYALIFLLTDAGLPELPAKLATEAALFVSSYAVQKRVLFRAARRAPVQDGSAAGAAQLHA